jgi:alkylation response protein AidB-like acyl-CoA dehydrogenase
MTAPALLDTARTLAAQFTELQPDATDAFPEEAFREVKRSGMLRAPLSVECGGLGASLAEATVATELVARASPAMALLIAMPLGLANMYGLGPDVAPEEHRRTWSEEIDLVGGEYRAGKWYAACNSEKGAGGSLEATKTLATRSNGRFHLTGEKVLASAGKHADFFFSSAKADPEDVPGCGVVETFVVPTDAPGVRILSDWDGFGMRPTESQTVIYESAAASRMMGFPNFFEIVQPVTAWYCLFAAIPLGCAAGMLDELARPAPESPALRLRFADAQMRIEAMRAYLAETASLWRPAAGRDGALRVLRTKTYVTQESTRLCAELFAMAGGRHYRRGGKLARMLADSFAGTALRPPLALALDTLVEHFALD